MGRHSTPLFDGLHRDGRFHLDTAIGRVFHPGTRSYRERAAVDSLHVAVTADNRVSVHVDRVSPLVVRAGRPCRYSLVRALVHNAVAAAEALVRLVRREGGRQRCELECRIVEVPDDDDWIEPDEDGDVDADVHAEVA